jgi:hypothetical protein
VEGGAESLSGGVHTTGTSTTVNGLWRFQNTAGGGDRFFRARFSSYTSGSAEIRVGIAGGQAPVAFFGGGFTGTPTRFYRRSLIRISANWTDGGNTGTKGLFFSQRPNADPFQRTNHFFYQSHDGLALQPAYGGPYERGAIPIPANGEWLDTEQILTAGTSGGSNGTAQMWINGVKVIDATGIPFFPSLQPAYWEGFYVNPTYGGGARPAPYDIYVDYGYTYWESAP